MCLLPVRAVGMPQNSGANFFMKELIIKSAKHGDQVCLVDDADFELVSKYKWRIEKGRTTFYAIHTNGWYAFYKGKTKTKGVTFRMHQLILGVQSRKDGGRTNPIDHKDHNGLNNQRDNICLTTYQNNSANCRKSRFEKLVPYKGVTLRNTSRNRPTRDRFISRIRVNDCLIHLGSFDTPEEAALKYNEAAIKHFGSSAYINHII